MKFILEKYKKTIKTKKNIFAIYGKNNSGKTLFIKYLEGQLISNKLPLFEDGYENYNDVIFIDENFSLKSELDLSKKSNLRKNLLIKIRDFIEKENIEILDNLKTSLEFNRILDLINKEINFTHEDFKIQSYLPYQTDLGLIDDLIKLKLFKGEEEFKESILSRTEKFEIFYNLFISIETKNKIIIFDTPDTGLDFLTLKKLSQFIKNLSKDNLIFLTYRNLEMFSLLDLHNEEFYFLSEQKIRNFIIDDKILLSYYINANNLIVAENINSSEKYKILFSKLKTVSNKDDLLNIKKDFDNNVLIKSVKYFDSSNNKLDDYILQYDNYYAFSFALFFMKNNIDNDDFIEQKLNNFEKKLIKLF